MKAFVNEAFEIARYGRSMDAYLRVALHGARLRGAFIAFIVFALFGCIVVVLWSGASLLQSGRITIGEMTRFVLYTAFVAGRHGPVCRSLQPGAKSGRRLPPRPGTVAGSNRNSPWSSRAGARATVRCPPCVARRSGIPRRSFPLSLAAGSGGAQGHFLCRAGPGRKSRWSGPAAPGKSTIISLLAALLRSAAGRTPGGWPPGAQIIRWPGCATRCPLCRRKPCCLAAPFSRTSPTAGPEPAEAEIMEAARLAHAHEFIAALPGGLPDPGGGTRREALRRPAPAGGHCARHPEGPGHSHSGRGHQLARFGERAAWCNLPWTA